MLRRGIFHYYWKLKLSEFFVELFALDMSGAILDTVDSALKLIPLIVGHFLYPTLSFINGQEENIFGELYRLLIPKRMLTYKFISKYLIMDNSWNQESPVSWLASLFLHANNEHLFGNLTSLIVASIPAIKHSSIGTVYFAFLGGGIVSMFPSPLKVAQNNGAMKHIEKNTADLVGNSYVGKLAQPALSGGLKFIRSIRDDSTRCLGSSGGVFSVMSLSAVLLADDLVSMIQESGSDTRTASSASAKQTSQSASYLSNIIDVISFAVSIYSEYSRVLHGSKKPLLETAFKIDEIGHAVHVQGAMFGCFVGLSVVFARRLRRHGEKRNQQS